jgi:TrmH family RNA methyltransferase
MIMKNLKTRRVASSQNKTLKLARSLFSKKYRLKENIYIIDGVKAVMEALRTDTVTTCFVNDERMEKLEENESLMNLLRKNPPKDIILLKDSLFQAISSTDNPQGIIALSRLPKYIYSKDNIEKLDPSSSLLPVLENVSDPGNTGTIIRLAAGAGLKEIAILGEGADPYGSKVVRASSGIISKVKIYKYDKTYDFLNRLKSLGYRILTTDANGKISLKKFRYPKKAALVFGGEARGISPESRRLADESVYIPLTNDIDSYNVAAAAAIFFYEFRNQKSN